MMKQHSLDTWSTNSASDSHSSFSTHSHGGDVPGVSYSQRAGDNAMQWPLGELLTWAILRPILTIALCLVCAVALVYFRRKLAPFPPRMASASLLAISVSHEAFVTFPYIMNTPPGGGGGGSSGWALGVRACQFYTWTVLYLGQTLGVVLTFITLHEWVQTHRLCAAPGHLKLGTATHVTIALVPWLISAVLALRLKAFTGDLAYLDTAIANQTACQLDVQSEQDIVNLRTTNILLEFLCPVTVSFLALNQLWRIERWLFSCRSERLRSGCVIGETPQVRHWMTSRTLPVAVFLAVYLVLRAPHCLMMLWLLCHPIALSKHTLVIWAAVARFDRMIYCTLPFIWILFQPEVPRTIYACARRGWRKLVPTGRRRSDGDVLWSVTSECVFPVSTNVPIYHDPNT